MANDEQDRETKLAWMKERIGLSPREAWEQARKVWPNIKLANVYYYRTALRKTGVKIPAAPTGGNYRSAARSSGKRDSRKETRRGHAEMAVIAHFVMGLPKDMLPAQVVEAAHKAGHMIRPSHVFALRKRYRTKPLPPLPATAPQAQLAIPETAAPAPAAPEPAPAGRPARKYTRRAEPVVLPLGALSTHEADYMGLVLDIGYHRAARLLAQFRAQFFNQIKAHTSED